jgi:hypothetical protein
MSQELAVNVFSGLIFFSIVYYVAYIPLRDKKAGIDQPHLFARIKRDVLKLFNK